MDRERFDALARFVWIKQSRRAALGAALGVALLGSAADLAAKPKPKAKKQRRRKRKQRKQRNTRPCYPGRTCIPGPGRDNAGCDFTSSTQFFEGNFQGAKLSHTNFTGAHLGQANLQGVDLGGACLVGANLFEADLTGAKLKGAIFCRTRMPDGSVNDRDCGGGARCCPTPATCEEGEADECVGDEPCQVRKIDALCTGDWIPFPNHCCPSLGLVCTPVLESPLVTTCQVPCKTDEDCQEKFGGGTTCQTNGQMCLYLPDWKCCR